MIQEIGGVTATSLEFPSRTALHLEPAVNGKIISLIKLFDLSVNANERLNNRS